MNMRVDRRGGSLVPSSSLPSAPTSSLSFRDSRAFVLSLTQNTSVSMADVPLTSAYGTSAIRAIVRIEQDAIGGRTVTWPVSVTLSASFDIDLSPNAVTIVELVSFNGTSWVATSWSGFNAETARDIIGAMLQNSNTVLLTHDDVANTITADVRLKASGGITFDASGLYLSGILPSMILGGSSENQLLAKGPGDTFVWVTSGATYTDTQAVNAVKAVVVDSTTIDFDTTTGITAAVRLSGSTLTSDGSGVKVADGGVTGTQLASTSVSFGKISTTNGAVGGWSLGTDGTNLVWLPPVVGYNTNTMMDDVGSHVANTNSLSWNYNGTTNILSANVTVNSASLEVTGSGVGVKAGGITPAMLNASNSASDLQVPAYNISNGLFQWVAMGSGGSVDAQFIRDTIGAALLDTTSIDFTYASNQISAVAKVVAAGAIEIQATGLNIKNAGITAAMLTSATYRTGDTLTVGAGGALSWGNQFSHTYVAFENLTAGDLVALHDDGGTIKLRRASKTGFPAVGFVDTSFALGSNAVLKTAGILATSGLSLNVRYYLGANGAISSTPPDVDGHLHQFIGYALSATSLLFMPSDHIELEGDNSSYVPPTSVLPDAAALQSQIDALDARLDVVEADPDDASLLSAINAIDLRVDALEAGGTGGGDVATDTIWGAKGDLAVGTANDSATRLPVGPDGYTIVADSSEPTGMKWAASVATASTLTERTITVKFAGGSTDGVQNNITTTQKELLVSPYHLRLLDWRMIVGELDSGSIHIGIQSKPFSTGSFTSVTSTNPAVVAGAPGQGTTSGWLDPFIEKDDQLKFSVVSRSGTVNEAKLLIRAIQLPAPGSPLLHTFDPPDADYPSAYSYAFIATGGTEPYAWSVTSGTLPTGLSLNSATGVLDGTTSAEGVFSFTVRVDTLDQQYAEEPVVIVVSTSGAVGFYFWRVNFVQNTGTNTYAAFQEVEFVQDIDGTDVASGGTAAASSTYSTSVAASAFDGDLVDSAAGTWVSSDNTKPQWLSYQKPIRAVIREVRLLPQNHAVGPARCPRVFEIQRSEDGTAWTTAASFTEVAGWTQGQWKSFIVSPSSTVIDEAQTPITLTRTDEGLRYTKNTSGVTWQRAICTTTRSTGKVILDLQIAATGYPGFGVVPAATAAGTNLASPEVDIATASCAFWTSARIYTGGDSYVNASLLTNTAGDWLRLYIDLATGATWVAKNAVLLGGDPANGTSPTTTVTNLGAFKVAVGAYEQNASGRIALDEDHINVNDPIPGGWSTWATSVAGNRNFWDTATAATTALIYDRATKLCANTSVAGTSANIRSIRALQGLCYFSGVLNTDALGETVGFGVADETVVFSNTEHWSGDVGGLSTAVWSPNGRLYFGGSNQGTVAAFASGDGVEWAVNVSARKAWVRKAGDVAWFGGGDPVTGTAPSATLLGTGALYVEATVWKSGATLGRSVVLHTTAEQTTGTPPAGFTKANWV